jgi:hypothetical protein
MGDPASPAGPVSAHEPLPASVDRTPQDKVLSSETSGHLHDFRFVDVTAGNAPLVKAVEKAGMAAVSVTQSMADNLKHEDDAVKVKDWLEETSKKVHTLALHFNITGVTFAKAKGRCKRSRVRSAKFPSGLQGKLDEVSADNDLANNLYRTACWAASELGALVTIEGPDNSYFWQHVEGGSNLDCLPPRVSYSDVVSSSCLYGSQVRRDHRLRCWNWCPAKLKGKCESENGVHSCGLPADTGLQRSETSQGALSCPRKVSIVPYPQVIPVLLTIGISRTASQRLSP